MISSVKHSISNTNKNKRLKYLLFLQDYSSYACRVFDYIKRYGYKTFSVRNNTLDIGKYIDYNDFNFIKTDLSARAKSSAINQVSALIRGCVEKQKRVNWVKKHRNINVKNKKFTLNRPEKIYPNLSSKCCDFKLSKNNKFLGFLAIKSVGSKYGKIIIPIPYSRKIEGEMKRGFLFKENHIQICFKEQVTPISKGDKILGIDQGLKSVVTLSDNQSINDKDNHGYTLTKIIEKISKKRKGSKAFKRAVTQRKNFVNWTINKINFNGVREVRLEKIVNIRYKKKTSKKMSHWSNPEIRDKIKRICEKLEVPVIEQSCAYRSQRCSNCGQVRKSNRSGKQYNCKNCGYSIDADYNASLNHVIDLPDVPRDLLSRKFNLRDGFFWLTSGFYLRDGSELRVPNSQN